MKNSIYLVSVLLFSFMLTGILSAQVVINEYSVSNLADFEDNHEKFEDWIELYNNSADAIDISGYHLSDKQTNPTKWAIPAGTTIPAYGFQTFWASGRDEVSGSHLHTNFKLTQTKSNEHIVFADPAGVILDAQTLRLTKLSHSRGRISDGNIVWGVYTNPTFGNSNNTANYYEGYTDRPEMSMQAGFYPGSITVSISSSEPNSTLHYTIDGSEPTAVSPIYAGPITISNTSILKAKSISNNPNILEGLIEFNTYFINENHTTRVVSTSSEELPFLLGGNQSYRPHGTFEYFNKDGERTARGYGEYNSHGQDSWVHDQRSFDWITRDEMGYAAALNDQIFSNKERAEFQRLILRAEGDDNYPGYSESAHIRDVYIHRLSQKAGLNIDERTGERCVTYVNGQYWGVYSIREKVDDPDFIESYYGQDKYNIDFIKTWGNTWVEYGATPNLLSNWIQLREQLVNADMSNQTIFENATEGYDYTSLVDYVLINNHTVCSDWLNYNVGWWRGLDPEGDHRKWGYILWDNDATFGHYINYTNIPSQTPDASACFAEVLTSLSQDPQKHIRILNNLKDNPGFNQFYVARYADLLNTGFHCDTMQNLLNDMEAEALPEMQRHFDRWGGSMSQWQGNIQVLRDFIQERCDFISGSLMDCHGLTGPYNLTLNVEPAGAGYIDLNSLSLNQFPWTGIYYGELDTKIKAIPASAAWRFDHWTVDNNNVILPNNLTQDAVVRLIESESITAHFVENTVVDELVINEINYNSAPNFDPEDWVEFYNPQPGPLDISGWYFSDDNDLNKFIFPAGTVIPGNGYLVLCRDIPAFSALFPNVTNIIGEMQFGMARSGELTRVFNSSDALVDSVRYDDKLPWPEEPDGDGATLQLSDPALDNALASSWFATLNNYGTPGEENGFGTGIFNPEEALDNLFVYPNPSSEHFVVAIPSNIQSATVTINIFDIVGKQIRALNISSNEQLIEIKRTGLASGMYTLLMVDEQDKAIGKAKLLLVD